MPRTFAIGDIHGCCKTFRKLLLEEINLEKEDSIYCIGDYVDRGPDSKGVIDLIISLRGEGYKIYTLRGNHEQMMLDAVSDRQESARWLLNGGVETLQSFRIGSAVELPGEYLTFLEGTDFFISTDKYVFVHAGLNFLIDSPFSDRDAMLWTRETYFDPSKIRNRILIHGHTPIPFKNIAIQLSGNVINIDAGCVYNHRPGLGHLVALSLPAMELMAVKNIDD
ncbi:MAG: metallophosphoesterase family protein [Ginsengibacter sp.]